MKVPVFCNPHRPASYSVFPISFLRHRQSQGPQSDEKSSILGTPDLPSSDCDLFCLCPEDRQTRQNTGADSLSNS